MQRLFCELVLDLETEIITIRKSISVEHITPFATSEQTRKSRSRHQYENLSRGTKEGWCVVPVTGVCPPRAAS